jgi:hypothetical protein
MSSFRVQDSEILVLSTDNQYSYKEFDIWRCMHRASSYNMYINQQDVQNSCD